MVDVKPHKRGDSDVKGHTRSPPRRRSPVAAAVAVTLALSGVAGGTSAVEGSVSSLGDYSGTRISRSEPEARGGGEIRIGRSKIQIRGSDDSPKVRITLQRLGHYPTTLDAESETVCDPYADGEAQRYLVEHRCVSIHRTLIEIRERNYAVRFATATIEMPDYASAEGLSALLVKDGGGDIAPLSPKDGRYRHVPFISASSHTTWHDTAVINTRVQGIGRTPGADLLASLATSVLFSLD